MTTSGPAAAAAQPGSVIHDIGYRHYTGRRLGTAFTVRALTFDSLRGAYGLGRAARTKVTPMLLFAIMCMPALIIAIVANVQGKKTLPLAYADYALDLQVILAIFVAAQAPVSVSRDLRFRVVSLYFSRPLRRQHYVVAKFAAFAGAIAVLIAVPLTILYAGALLAHMSFWTQTRGWLEGLLGAVLFALVLAGVGLVIAAVTPRRGLGVAAVLGTFMILIAFSGTLQGVAHTEGHPATAGYVGLISPFGLVDGVQVWLFGKEPSSVAGPPGTTGGIVFTLATLALVAACFGALIQRYRKVSLS